MTALHYDILVVGAGPAGSCAAAAAAEQGARTLLIEAKTRIGEQPHCGEFVPRQLFTEFNLNRACVIQSVERMQTVIIESNMRRPGSNPQARVDWISRFLGGSNRAKVQQVHGPWVSANHESRSPGLLIDRVRFDRDLARAAAAQGATVLSSARLVGRADDSWIVRHRGRELHVRARYVIAGDGPVSTVASVLGLKRSEMLRGVQVEAPLARPQEKTFVFLSRNLVGGYGWLFPKKTSANVGLGVLAVDDLNPAELLEELLEGLVSLGLIRPGILARSAGLIPVSGIREGLVQENVIFCGDAAHLTHPITGAGIPQAVFSGMEAGRAAARALKTGSSEPLCQYEEEIRGRYKGVMLHARSKRDLMMSRWHESEFAQTCQQTWIAFQGYRKRVRAEKQV